MTTEREGLVALVDAILREFPMSDDGTGHIADCGFDSNDERCDCLTLRPRLADLLAARDRRVRAEVWDEALAEAANRLRSKASVEMHFSGPRDERGAAIWDAGCFVDPRDGAGVDNPYRIEADA